LDCGAGDVPYHARQDSRPFTYGLPGSQPHSSSDTNTMSSTSTSTTLRSVVYNGGGGGGDREARGLASPSLVRKASFGKKSTPTAPNGYAGNNNTNTWSSASSNKSGWNSTLSSDAHLYSNG
jgi:hypothetical protein